LLHAGADLRASGAGTRGPGWSGGAGEIGQVGAFGFVELQRAGQCVEDVVGDAAGVAAFELGVVVDADPGQHGDFLAAQARDAPVTAVGGQAGLLRGDPGPPGGQEIPDLAPAVHASHVR
jgi:hypothetical protein